MSERFWEPWRAWRGLWRRRAFTAGIVVPLALAIGATVAVFTVVRSVLLAPLDFPRSDRLVSIRHQMPDGSELLLSTGSYLDLQDFGRVDGNGLFDSLAAYRRVDATLVGSGDPTTVESVQVTPSFFEVLSVAPGLGRPFEPGMDRIPAPTESLLDHGSFAVLSHHLWRTRFGADPSVVGRTLELDHRALEIVGVMPEDFEFPADGDVFVPLGFGEAARQDHGGYYLETLGRLADGISLQRVRNDTADLAARLRASAPASSADLELKIVPLKDLLVEDLDLGLWLLFGISALVLVLVATNAAQLFLAHCLREQQAMAVRLALGAGRRHIAERILSESLVLSLLATVLGSSSAIVLLQGLMRMAPADLLAGRDIGFGFAGVVFALLIAVGVGAVLAVAPTLYLSRSGGLPRRLIEGGRAQSSGRGRRRLQDAMLACQIALAIILTHATVLMTQSYLGLQARPLGFEPEGVVALTLNLPPERYSDEESLRSFGRRVVREIAAVPGVMTSGLGLRLPVVDGSGGIWFRTPSQQADAAYAATLHTVDAGFLDTLGMPILRGRGVSAADHAGSQPVVVINRCLAESYFPGRDPVGQTLILTPWPDQPWTVVGMVANLPQGGLKKAAEPAIFVPFDQLPLSRLQVVAKVEGHPEQAFSDLRRAVWNVDSGLGIQSVAGLDGLLASALLADRFSAGLVGLYSLLGMVLVALGLFAVTAFFVESRRAEIGVRLALGSNPSTLPMWVLRKGSGRFLLGCGAGLFGAVLLADRMQAHLFQIEALDPVLLLSSVVLPACIVLPAHWLPARRAAGTDPAEVLRRR